MNPTSYGHQKFASQRLCRFEGARPKNLDPYYLTAAIPPRQSLPRFGHFLQLRLEPGSVLVWFGHLYQSWSQLLSVESSSTSHVRIRVTLFPEQLPSTPPVGESLGHKEDPPEFGNENLAKEPLLTTSVLYYSVCLWTEFSSLFFEFSRFAQPKAVTTTRSAPATKYAWRTVRIAHKGRNVGVFGSRRQESFPASNNDIWYRYRCDQDDLNYEAIHWVRH